MSAPRYPYESATPEQRTVGAWWWCVHHEIHCEPLTEPVETRVSYIRSSKPAGEIETRLRELRPVLHPERLPVAVIKAGRAYGEAWRAYGEAGHAHDEARRAYDEAWRAYGEAGHAHDEARRAHDKARRAHGEARRAHGEAGRAYDEAWRACAEAWRAHGEARHAYDEARRAHEPELMALHREEYPDTQWNGLSIFAEGVK